MAFSQDPLSSPETYYYQYNVYYTGEDEVDFIEIDTLLIESSSNLDHSPEHAGAARDFDLTLENYDEITKTGEILASFVIRLWEDDDNELNLILTSISEELETQQLMVEDVGFVGTGPARKR